MEENKYDGNVTFNFHSDIHRDVNLSMEVDSDSECGEICEIFKKFLYCIGYTEETIDKYVY